MITLLELCELAQASHDRSRAHLEDLTAKVRDELEKRELMSCLTKEEEAELRAELERLREENSRLNAENIWLWQQARRN